MQPKLVFDMFKNPKNDESGAYIANSKIIKAIFKSKTKSSSRFLCKDYLKGYPR